MKDVTKIAARNWAYFIVNKLGLPYSKTEIVRFAENASDDAVWNKYIVSHDECLATAKANHIEGPCDVMLFFERVSYANMRSTFPSKAHGRGVLGPSIVTMQKLKEKSNCDENDNSKYRVSLSKLQELNDTIGKTIVHSADNGLSYGKGVIVGVIGEKCCIIVEFESGDKRTFNYEDCIEKGFIRFIDNSI